jgi:DNA-binding MarR family transcriptional regulator
MDSFTKKSDIGWTVLSNHGHVLVCLVRDPDVRLRDVALKVGITERAVQKIVADLETAGFLVKTRVSRNNSYTFNHDAPLRHPLESNQSIGELLKLFI